MKGLLVVALLLALLGAGSALAAKGDPQERFNPADQARARAMLLKKADLGIGFRAQPSGGGGGTDFACPALDESALTITGKAQSPNFTASLIFASSEAEVYESVGDANVSWNRGASAAGTKCLRDGFRREFASQSLVLLSLRRVAFPRVAPRTAAYRIVFSGQSQGVTVKVVVDVVALMHSRAQLGLFVGSALVPPARSALVRLARLSAGRMAKAMRGA